MRTAAFILTETNDDLIVSFALSIADDPTEVESLTLHRTPKYEVFHEERERGVTVSLELQDKGLLKRVAFDQGASAVRLRTSQGSFEVDLRSVSRTDITEMLNVLMLMNFDSRFEISGLE